MGIFFWNITKKKILLVRMRVLAPRSDLTLRPSSIPAEFFGTCATFLFQAILIYFSFFLENKNLPPPNTFFTWNPVQNFITLGQPLALLGEKYVTRKETKKIILKNSGHYVLLQRPRAVHSLCSDQSFFGGSWGIESRDSHMHIVRCVGAFWDTLLDFLFKP